MEEGDRKLCLGFYSTKTSHLFLLVSPHGGWKKSFTLQVNCFSAVKSKADFLLLGVQFEVGVESSSATVKLTLPSVIHLQSKICIWENYIIWCIAVCNPLEIKYINS